MGTVVRVYRRRTGRARWRGTHARTHARTIEGMHRHMLADRSTGVYMGIRAYTSHHITSHHITSRLVSTGGPILLLLGALVQLARADDPVLGLVLVAVERHRTVAQPAKWPESPP